MKSVWRYLWILGCIFACPLGAATWSMPPLDASLTGGDADVPQVAVDTNGNAVAVWQRFDGANTIIQSATLSFRAAAWSTVTDLSAVGQDAADPQVAVDASGNAVAVWSRNDGANTIIQSRSKPLNMPWSIVTDDISAVGENASLPQVVLDPVGNAIAVWQRFNGLIPNVTAIEAATKPFNMAWTGAATLSTAGQNAIDPQIAIDPIGNAIAVWSRFDGTHSIIQSAYYEFLNSTWQLQADLSAPGQDAAFPQVGISASSVSTATWQRSNGTNVIIQSATLLAPPFHFIWSTPVDVSPLGFNSSVSQIAVDLDGNAVAVWATFNGPMSTIQSSTLPFSGVWTTPVVLSNSQFSANLPQVGVDGAGNAVSIWEYYASDTIIQSSTLAFGTAAWSTPTDLSIAGENSDTTQVSVNADGTAVVVWRRFNGSNYIVQSTWANIAIAPPASAFGQQIANDFGLQAEYFNLLKWTKSSSTNVAGYRIYRNGIFIAQVSANILQYRDHGREPNSLTTYSITSVDSFGSEGEPITIVVS